MSVAELEFSCRIAVDRGRPSQEHTYKRFTGRGTSDGPDEFKSIVFLFTLRKDNLANFVLANPYVLLFHSSDMLLSAGCMLRDKKVSDTPRSLQSLSCRRGD